MSAIIFPGQGSQYSGMAIDFNDNFKVAREIFDEIEDITSLNIRNLIKHNENDKLNQTNFTQLSIFSASIAIYKTLISEIGLHKIKPSVVLGHSLGEYSALVANNSLTIADASKLIQVRGDLMNSAIEPNKSGMAAIIGKNSEFVDQIISTNKLNIEIANDNSPIQVVVSGLIDDVNKAKETFIKAGAKKYVILNVSAAFHSKFMLEAQNKLNDVIDKTVFNSNSFPIISNFNAKINIDKTDILASLKKQMSNRVKWTESIQEVESSEIVKIYEIGPGKVLSGLISRISKKFDIISIDKVIDLNKVK